MKNKRIPYFFVLPVLILMLGSPAFSACTTSTAGATCGPYTYSGITESNNNTSVLNQVYNTSYTQTLNVTSPGNWYVTDDVPSGINYPVADPVVEQNYNGETVDTLSQLVSGFTVNMNANSNTFAQAHFEIYLNSWGTHVTINHAYAGSNPACSSPVASNVSFGGSNGIPTATWDLCGSGSSWTWTITSSAASSSVDLRAMIEYLETNGEIASGSTLSGIYYGFKIGSTGGSNENFQVSALSINSSSSSNPSFTLSSSPSSVSVTQGNATTSTVTVTPANGYAGSVIFTVSGCPANATCSMSSSSVTISSGAQSATLNLSTTSSTATGTYTVTVEGMDSVDNSLTSSATVSLTVNSSGGGTPAISLSPTSLGFSATAGGSNPSSQTVSVSNSGSGTLASPTTSISYSQGSGWLSASVSGSSAPYTITVQPNISGLSAGTYDATVSVASSGASNTPQTFSVALTVNSSSACTSSAASYVCGPYNYPQITANGTYNLTTQQDVWGPVGSWSQALTSYSPGDWWVYATFNNNGGQIQTYPDLTISYGDAVGPSNYSYMYSSFTENVTGQSNVVSDIGFDIWHDNWTYEVMIQHQMINTPSCTTWSTVRATNVQFGGSNGVPVNTWNLCQNGTGSSGELVWQITDPNGSSNFGFSSGSVDILAMEQWLQTHDVCNGNNSQCLPSNATFTAIQYGFEIAGASNDQFQVTDFSLTSDHP